MAIFPTEGNEGNKAKNERKKQRNSLLTLLPSVQ
jgi:hypothetical protein